MSEIINRLSSNTLVLSLLFKVKVVGESTVMMPLTLTTITTTPLENQDGIFLKEQILSLMTRMITKMREKKRKWVHMMKWRPTLMTFM